MVQQKSLPIFFAVVFACLLLWATYYLEGKWVVATLIGIGFIWTSIIARNPERFLFFLFVLFLSMEIDIHFSQQLGTGGADGLILNACDVVLFALYAVWMVKLSVAEPEKKRIRLFPSLSIPFWLLILWNGFSIMGAADRVVSFYEYIQLIKAWFAFLYIANNIHEENQLRDIGLALCIGVLLQSLLAFAQHIFGVTLGLEAFGESRHSLLFQKAGLEKLRRAGGTFGHPNALAFFLVMTLPVILSLSIGARQFWLKSITFFIFVVEMLALVLTFSRGGWISFAFAAPFVLLLGVWKRWGFFRACATLVLFGFLALVVALPFAPSIKKRIFERDSGAAWSRVSQIHVAWNMIQAHPLFGVGLNNYALVMQSYDDTPDSITLKVKFPVHNAYFLTTAEAGVPAVFFLFWLMLSLLKKGWDGFWRLEGFPGLFCLGLLGGLAACLIDKLVEFKYFASNYLFVLFMGLLAASKFWHERSDSNH